MAFKLYDFMNQKGENEFKAWATTLQRQQLAKLNEKLDKLAMHGEELHPHVLTDTPVPGIQKLRIHGNVQLRPLLCRGPVVVGQEYTLLMGAKEVGGKLVPKDAPATAAGKKEEVISSPDNRRVLHERVGKKSDS